MEATLRLRAASSCCCSGKSTSTDTISGHTERTKCLVMGVLYEKSGLRDADQCSVLAAEQQERPRRRAHLLLTSIKCTFSKSSTIKS